MIGLEQWFSNSPWSWGSKKVTQEILWYGQGKEVDGRAKELSLETSVVQGTSGATLAFSFFLHSRCGSSDFMKTKSRKGSVLQEPSAFRSDIHTFFWSKKHKEPDPAQDQEGKKYYVKTKIFLKIVLSH